MIYTRHGVMSMLVNKRAKTLGVAWMPTSEEPGVAKVFISIGPGQHFLLVVYY